VRAAGEWDDILHATAAVYLKVGSSNKTAKEMGLSRNAVQNRIKECVRRGMLGSPEMAPPGFVVARNTTAYDGDGKPKGQWVSTKPEPGPDFEPLPGFAVKQRTTHVNADGRVLEQWVQEREGAEQRAALIDALRETFAEYKGMSPPIPDPAVSDDDILTEYPIVDLHLGQQSWGKESGENYNVKIAVETATKSLTSLVEQSRPSAEAVVLFMGDYTHSNDEKGVTPAHQHRLDNDGRWQKVYTAAAKLAVSLIEIVARKHQRVTVRVLKGNHDPDAAVSLAVALSLFYSNNPRITIEDDPSITWYRRFGRCLIAATHGHTQKPEAMAMAMPVDCAEDWGQTTYRHIAYGHVHHASVKEIMGIIVESFQAITARDAHAVNNGYRSGRSLTALTWHREHGEIGRHRVNISGASARREAA
jgi:predicted phosphodiesterase